MNQPITHWIDHPSAWQVPDLGGKEDIAITLREDERSILMKALEAIKKRDLSLEDITAADFDLGPMSATVAGWSDEILNGRGFVLLRGFPIDLPQEDIETLYWAFGTHFGQGQSQSVLGDLVGQVQDFSGNDPNARAYRNKQELSLHTDLTAIIAMLSLQKAPKGGVSQYASAITIHNFLARENPHLLAPLYEGFHYYRQGEEMPGQMPYTEWKVPIFSSKEGQITIRWIRSFVEAGHVIKDDPLTELQIAAMDALDEISHRPDVRLDLLLEPGDLMMTNNYTTLHARTAFEDSQDQRRHLLRLWLARDDARPIVDSLDHFGAGGGIPHQADKQPSGEGELLYNITGHNDGDRRDQAE